MKKTFVRAVAWYLAAAMFLIGIVPKVEAGLAPSELMTAPRIDRTSDMGKIQKALEMKMVGTRLAQLGLTREEIQTRLDGLSDQQVHEVALKLDDVRVGGDGVGLVIGLLIVAILVVVLLQLTDHRVVITGD